MRRGGIVADDIARGPDYVARVLSRIHNEDEAELGEAPVSMLETISDAYGDAREKAMARVTKSRKPLKLTTTITLVDTISFGSGDAARLETSVAHDIKWTKPAPVKGGKAWLDKEGNQIGSEPAQTKIKGLDGGRANEDKPKRKAI
jgi:hypothetical protein